MNACGISIGKSWNIKTANFIVVWYLITWPSILWNHIVIWTGRALMFWRVKCRLAQRTVWIYSAWWRRKRHWKLPANCSNARYYRWLMQRTNGCWRKYHCFFLLLGMLHCVFLFKCTAACDRFCNCASVEIFCPKRIERHIKLHSKLWYRKLVYHHRLHKNFDPSFQLHNLKLHHQM